MTAASPDFDLSAAGRPTGHPTVKTSMATPGADAMQLKISSRSIGMLWRWILFAAVVNLVLPVGAFHAEAQDRVLVNRVVAEVNDDIITLYELNQAAAPYLRRVRALGRPLSEERQMLYDVREEMLNQLIDHKLTDQEVRRYNISVSEASIDNAMEVIKKRSLMTDQQLRESLGEEDMTIDEYRQQIKNQILRSRLVTRQVKSKIVITDEDIRAVYEQDPTKYGGQKIHRLRQIVVKTSSGEAQARQKMEMILAKLDAGGDFADLAREYSDGPMAKDGGLLGEFKIEDLAAQIRGALQGLKAGDHTSILTTDRGLQIFYIDDLKISGGKSLEQARPEIEDQLYDQIVNRKFKNWLSELRERSHIKIIR
jgi:peptidyl-prolyl cis-trans isomerase SurA